jgi:hypothetical protein
LSHIFNMTPGESSAALQLSRQHWDAASVPDHGAFHTLGERPGRDLETIFPKILYVSSRTMVMGAAAQGRETFQNPLNGGLVGRPMFVFLPVHCHSENTWLYHSSQKQVINKEFWGHIKHRSPGQLSAIGGGGSFNRHVNRKISIHDLPS